MVSTPTRPPSKKDVARSLLLRGSCFVHLDPRREDVAVPDWLRKQPQLVLQVGFDMPVPIPDLRVDDDGVFGTLSFSRSAFSCSIAWSAVFALVGDDGKGMVWPEDIPEEIAEEVERETRRQRPVLVGVNDDPPKKKESPGRQPKASPALAPAPEPAEKTPSPRPAAKTRPRAASTTHEVTPKPKASKSKGTGRKLPPYLRIVK